MVISMYISVSQTCSQILSEPSVWLCNLSIFCYIQVALVTWTEDVGLTLVKRDLNYMKLRTPSGDLIGYSILQIFPFTSETKRMGIIVKACSIDFIYKGRVHKISIKFLYLI